MFLQQRVVITALQDAGDWLLGPQCTFVRKLWNTVKDCSVISFTFISVIMNALFCAVQMLRWELQEVQETSLRR